MKAIQKRSLLTQEKILSVAEQLLRDNPYVELTIPSVAKNAKVSVGGLYGRFKSREELLAEVYNRYRLRRNERINLLLEAKKSESSDLLQRLSCVSELFVSLHLADGGILRSFIIHHWLTASSRPSKEIKSEISSHLSRLTEYIIGGDVRLKDQSSRVSTVLGYMVSISKDSIVIKPETSAEINLIDKKSLVADITRMASSLLVF